MSKATACTTDGCDRPPVARKMCGTCYARWSRKVKKGTPCAGDGCDRNATTRGWCQKHYERWLKHGDANWQPPQPIEGCSIDGCDKPHASRGWCSTHYSRWQKHRDPKWEQHREARTCSIDGCDRAHKSRGWCSLHYGRWAEHGNPLGVAPKRPSKALQRLQEIIAADPTDCVFMPGGGKNPNGSKSITHEGRSESAHRLVLKFTVGDPSEGTEACHSCGNGHLGCVTPRHLRWDTHQANIDDKIAHGTMLRGEAHGGAKLTEAQVRAIREDTRRPGDIAVDYDVTYMAIVKIRKRLTWQHVE